jgi:predicted aldo/keto reductase-like oxidoreductase
MKNGVKREDCMLLTKTASREPALIKADLERFRKELNTDYLDIVLLHCLTDADWTTKLQPCMDALEEAKSKGIVRAHGCSCHHLDALKLAAETPWVDVILSRINPFGVKMDGAPEDVAAVLQKAHANGKGVLGMKIAGEGEMKDRIPESLKFVLGLGCVDAMTIGCVENAEIDANITHFQNVAAA